MELVPKTTAMSIETFSSVGKAAPYGLDSEVLSAVVLDHGYGTRWLIRAAS
jgi:hypothetical protein